MELLSQMITTRSKDSLRSHRYSSAIRSMLDFIFSTLQSSIELKIDLLPLREKFSLIWQTKVKFSRWFYLDIGWILDNQKIT